MLQWVRLVLPLECPEHRHLMHLLLCAQNCAEVTKEDQGIGAVHKVACNVDEGTDTGPVTGEQGRVQWGRGGCSERAQVGVVNHWVVVRSASAGEG